METRLFRVDLCYIGGSGPEAYVAKVLEVCIIKETTKCYFVASDYSSHWSSRIFKDDESYSFTPVEAWDVYIARAEQLLAQMKSRLQDTERALTFAYLQRALEMANQVKIGGTA